jgi:hypothetical protein
MPKPNFYPMTLDHSLSEFCELLSPGKTPFFVSVRPKKWCKEHHCFPNVFEKIRLSGGRIVYGWEIVVKPKIEIEARFHAVWESTGHSILDITPNTLSPSRILFLEDVHRKYTGASIPNLYHPLGDEATVEKFWAVREQYHATVSSLHKNGYPPGHPIYQEQAGHLKIQMDNLRAQLENA